MNYDECPVCLDNLNTKIKVTLPCNHSMCITCLFQMTQLSCPCCRESITNLLPSQTVYLARFQKKLLILKNPSSVLTHMIQLDPTIQQINNLNT